MEVEYSTISWQVPMIFTQNVAFFSIVLDLFLQNYTYKPLGEGV